MTSDRRVLAINENEIVWSVARDRIAAELRHRPLLVMLHGYGSHELDLSGLAGYLPIEYVVASVRGLEPAGAGFSWFPLEWNPATNELRGDANDAVAAADTILEWLDRLTVQAGDEFDISLFGFSQGGAMALQLLRQRPSRFRAAVLLSGFALPDESTGHELRDAALATASIPVFWGRDPQDPIITPDLISYTRRWLPEHSELVAKLYSHVGHGISMEELEDVRDFLTRVLDAPD